MQLEAAEAEAAECDAKVASCDGEIALVRRRFEKPLTRLAVRRANVATASEAWEERRAALSARAAALRAAQRAAAEARRQRHVTLGV